MKRTRTITIKQTYDSDANDPFTLEFQVGDETPIIPTTPVMVTSFKSESGMMDEIGNQLNSLGYLKPE